MIANIARIQKAHDTEMQVIKLLFGHPLKSKCVASTWPSTSALSGQMLKSTRIRAKYDTNAEEALFILSKNPKTNKMSFNR